MLSMFRCDFRMWLLSNRFSHPGLAGLYCQHESNDKSERVLLGPRGSWLLQAVEIKGVKNMLAVVAAVLIVLWLLGFLAFHVSSGLVHVLLVIGIVMLLLHIFRGRSATAWTTVYLKASSQFAAIASLVARVRVQFGKIYGIALAVLGKILLGIQGMLYIPTEAVSTVRLSLPHGRLNIKRTRSWESSA
jgi:hypothetical protein